MLIRRLAEANQGPRRIVTDQWESTRLLLRNDRMGFSFHITTIYPDQTVRMHYRHHLEAVYCLQGEGEIEDLGTGQRHPIRPGTLYALDQHDRHILRSREALLLACVFNPPLHGTEVHDATGAYPVEAETVTD